MTAEGDARLAQQWREAAASAAEAARLVGALSPRFAVLVAEVVDVVGGSAQRVDQQMVATMREAQRQLQRAELSLAACLALARNGPPR